MDPGRTWAPAAEAEAGNPAGEKGVSGEEGLHSQWLEVRWLQPGTSAETSAGFPPPLPEDPPPRPVTVEQQAIHTLPGDLRHKLPEGDPESGLEGSGWRRSL